MEGEIVERLFISFRMSGPPMGGQGAPMGMNPQHMGMNPQMMPNPQMGQPQMGHQMPPQMMHGMHPGQVWFGFDHFNVTSTR